MLLLVICRAFNSRRFSYSNILVVLSPYSWVSGSYLSFALTGAPDQIWRSWRRKYYHDHVAVFRFSNHFYFESLSSHIIQVYMFVCIFIKLAIFILFLLSSIVTFVLYCMLNILRYVKIFCEMDEPITL